MERILLEIASHREITDCDRDSSDFSLELWFEIKQKIGTVDPGLFRLIVLLIPSS